MLLDVVLVLVLDAEAWAYNLFIAGFSIFLKYFEISLTSLVDLVLRLMPLGNNVDLGEGYDDMISYATCSLSQRLMQ